MKTSGLCINETIGSQTLGCMWVTLTMPVLHREYGSINVITQFIKDEYKGEKTPLILSLEVAP